MCITGKPAFCGFDARILPSAPLNAQAQQHADGPALRIIPHLACMPRREQEHRASTPTSASGPEQAQIDSSKEKCPLWQAVVRANRPRAPNAAPSGLPVSGSGNFLPRVELIVSSRCPIVWETRHKHGMYSTAERTGSGKGSSFKHTAPGAICQWIERVNCSIDIVIG